MLPSAGSSPGGPLRGRVDSTGLVTGARPARSRCRTREFRWVGGHRNRLCQGHYMSPPASRVEFEPGHVACSGPIPVVVSADAVRVQRRPDATMMWCGSRGAPAVVFGQHRGKAHRRAGLAGPRLPARRYEPTHHSACRCVAKPVVSGGRSTRRPRPSGPATWYRSRSPRAPRRARRRETRCRNEPQSGEWADRRRRSFRGGMCRELSGDRRLRGQFGAGHGERAPRDRAAGPRPCRTVASSSFRRRNYGSIPTASTDPHHIGDRIYAVDISTRPTPRSTDSVVVMHGNSTIDDDGGRQFGVLTRENASTGKNGMWSVVRGPGASQAIAEFTETLTGGVHCTFIYKGYVYLTD